MNECVFYNSCYGVVNFPVKGFWVLWDIMNVAMLMLLSDLLYIVIITLIKDYISDCGT